MMKINGLDRVCLDFDKECNEASMFLKNLVENVN